MRKKLWTTGAILVFMFFTINVYSVMVLNRVPPDGGDSGTSSDLGVPLAFSGTQSGAYWWLKAQAEINQFLASYEIGLFDVYRIDKIIEYIWYSNWYFDSVIKEMPEVESEELNKLMNYDYSKNPFENRNIYETVVGFLKKGDAKGLRIYHLSMQKEVYSILLKMKDSCYAEKEEVWKLLEKTQNISLLANYASRLCYTIL